VILPLMLAVVVSHLVSASLNPDSIYTRKLRREGGMRSPRPGLSVLDTLLVTDAMKTDVPTAAPGDRVSDLAARMHREHIRSLPVVTNGDGLIGIVTEHDVEMALVGEDATERTVDEIMTRSLQTCTESETLAAVLHRFAARNVRQIPVVEPGDPPRLRGVIRREELLWAYGEVAEEHEQLLAQADGTQPAGRDEAFIADLEIVSSDRALRDRCISDLGLPSHALVVRMRRAGHDIIPKGATRVEAGDLLTIYTTSDRARELREWIARVHPES
jgi:CIC family chloride channel protein